jgi:hypothetical protein
MAPYSYKVNFRLLKSEYKPHKNTGLPKIHKSWKNPCYSGYKNVLI